MEEKDEESSRLTYVLEVAMYDSCVIWKLRFKEVVMYSKLCDNIRFEVKQILRLRNF